MLVVFIFVAYYIDRLSSATPGVIHFSLECHLPSGTTGSRDTVVVVEDAVVAVTVVTVTAAEGVSVAAADLEVADALP